MRSRGALLEDSSLGAPSTSGREHDRVQQRLRRVTRKEVVDVLGKAALCYVGVKAGFGLLRFVGRVLRPGARGQSPGAGASAQANSSGAAPSSAVPVKSDDTWNVVDAEAPLALPEGYKPITNVTLPCSVQDFYRLLLSGSSGFWSAGHEQAGRQWDIVLNGWQRTGMAGGDAGAAPTDQSLLGTQSVFEYVLGSPGSGGYSRLLTFVQPKKPPASVDAKCVQRQQFVVYRGDKLVLATATSMLNIPFKDCFTVNTLWHVVPGADPSTCTVTIHLKVHFLRRPLVAGIISATSFRDTSAFYKVFMDKAAERLQQASSAPGAVAPAAPSPSSAAAARRAAAPLASTMPAWKQVRAAMVFFILVVMVLHHYHLSKEVLEVKVAAGLIPPTNKAEGGSGGSSSGGGPLGAAAEAAAGALALLQGAAARAMSRLSSAASSATTQ